MQSNKNTELDLQQNILPMTKVKSIKQFCPIRRVGNGTYNHFFGYYNKSIWDETGRHLLSQRIPMTTGDLTGKEIAEVGFFDLECNDFYQVIGHTSSWNWQMGCQLQWLENSENWQIIWRELNRAFPAAYDVSDPKSSQVWRVQEVIDQRRWSVTHDIGRPGSWVETRGQNIILVASGLTG